MKHYWFNKLFELFNWSLELWGIRPMMEIPSCSSTPHPAPPLLRLGLLLLWSIDSTHFHSRNPSAAYQHSSLSQGHCLFPYPCSWIPGLYSHRAVWMCVFTQPPASKEECLSGKAASTPTGRHAEYKYIAGDLFALDTNLLMSLLCIMSIFSIVWLVTLTVYSYSL